MGLTEKVKMVEVGPRDGLQNEPGAVSTAAKVELIDRLGAAGVTLIEVGSVVSPKRVPQMAETADVVTGSSRLEGVRHAALTPNLQGYEAAMAAGVQGVGAKVALAILSILSPAEVQAAIAKADAAMVARANGVGPKLAQRIVNELKDKAGGVAIGGGAGATVPASGAANDAVSALLNLGFKPAEASNAVGAASDELGPSATLDALVRLALRKAAK